MDSTKSRSSTPVGPSGSSSDGVSVPSGGSWAQPLEVRSSLRQSRVGPSLELLGLPPEVLESLRGGSVRLLHLPNGGVEVIDAGSQRSHE